MSRIPTSQRQPRTPVKSSVTASATPRSKAPSTPTASTPSRISRPKPTPSRALGNGTPTKKPVPPKAPPKEAPETPSAPAISIRDAIALKRAEAKKAQKASAGATGLDSISSLEDAIPIQPKEEVVEEGRWSLRDTIERARSSGSANFAARSLPCIPSALFEIHMGVKPEPLASVPEEPPLPESSRKRTGGDNMAWFEQQDLTILKAWNNDIVEIQPEISMFGSLKVFDLHDNKIEKLPDSFCDLTALTNLDLSQNQLTCLPSEIYALPELQSLKISHNNFTSLPLNAPFKDGSVSSNGRTAGSLYAPTITRSGSTLPRLINLEAAHNKISAGAIDLTFPTTLMRLDLSDNPLGISQELIITLAALPKLKELKLAHADISDEAFSMLDTSGSPFPNLIILDLEETKVSEDAIRRVFKNGSKELQFEFAEDEPPAGVLRVTVGKRVIKEAWEIELERKQKSKPQIVQEDWGDEEPVLTEGAKRRMRAEAAAAEAEASSSRPAPVKPPASPAPAHRELSPAKEEPPKEQWELEAEQGLLSEGAKRRARALAASAEEERLKQQQSAIPARTSSPGSGLASSQYYNSLNKSLELPASASVPKAHSRAFSLASGAGMSTSTTDIAVPTPTLPLAEISTQSFTPSLKVLIANNRKLNKSASVPSDPDFNLPCLEELALEGCELADSIDVSLGSASARHPEPLVPLITRVCPNLRILNLSYNALTSSALSKEVLDTLLLKLPLKHLSLRGNALADLDGFQAVALMFKGNRDVPEWTLDELDLRDNEIGRIPPELGLLPLDVFLVDGNVFRVPARRIWEREGTRGLLSWLRGRIE